MLMRRPYLFQIIIPPRLAWYVLGLILSLVGCADDIWTSKRPASIPKLIDRSQDMSVLRTEFRRTASIRFFTIYPAYCRLQYWPVQLGDDPADERRKEAGCFRTVAGESHFVRIENLDPQVPHYMRLLVSSSDPLVQTIDDRIILKENAGFFSYFPGTKPASEAEDRATVTVVKANLTQATAGIYSNFVDDQMLAEEKREFVKKTKGCKPYPPPQYHGLLPPRDIGLTEMSTSGYYSTLAVELDKRKGVYFLDFTGKHEPAIHWLFRLKLGEDELHYQVPSPPEFRSVKLTGAEDMTLLRHDLIHEAPVRTLPAREFEGLEFIWRSRNVLDGDFVEILIGKPALGEAIRCQFSAKAKTARLSLDDLAQVRGNIKDVVVSLNRKLVSAEQKSHFVFLHTHDWRHIKLKLP